MKKLICDLCSQETGSLEVCQDNVCKGCHVSITWEDCTSGEWKRRMDKKNREGLKIYLMLAILFLPSSCFAGVLDYCKRYCADAGGELKEFGVSNGGRYCVCYPPSAGGATKERDNHSKREQTSESKEEQ